MSLLLGECLQTFQVQTFLEANAKGYWDTDEDNLQKLRDVYQDTSDGPEMMLKWSSQSSHWQEIHYTESLVLVKKNTVYNVM